MSSDFIKYPGLPEIFWVHHPMRFFVLEYWFYVNVPDTYDHDHLIQMITGGAEEPLSDESCARASHRLIPGRRYGVKIFRVHTPIDAESCLFFLKAQSRTCLVGAQGSFFLARYYRHLLPFCLPLFSLDEAECLPRTRDNAIVMPFAERTTYGPINLGYGEFNSFLPPCTGIVCFSEVPRDFLTSSQTPPS